MVTRSRGVLGFTLLELLLVIIIIAILAAVLAPVVREPIRAYFAQATRATLVDAAASGLRRIARDARRSLPYSVRVNGGQTAVEFVSVLDVARYREQGGPGSERLQFNNPDGSFNVIGEFLNVGNGALAAGQRLAIFNRGGGAYDIYNPDPDGDGADVATPLTTTVAITTIGTEDQVTMNPSFQFQASSPSQRVYITGGTVSYACFNDGLFRDDDNGYNASQPPPAVVANGDLVTADVSACRFDYDPGNANRPGLLIMNLTLSRDGESITLLHQVHIPNAT